MKIIRHHDIGTLTKLGRYFRCDKFQNDSSKKIKKKSGLRFFNKGGGSLMASMKKTHPA